jgi:hypothetical protein
MITAPSNSHLFFVIEGLPISIPSAIPVPSVNSTDTPCIEDVYEGNCPVLLQTMRLPCSMPPLRVRWLSYVSAAKSPF